ncbi:MAG: nuclear transport factor 2 family protein [Planctomycetaceae bacterium]
MSAILPPFNLESATAKVRAAEDAWNSRDPHRVSLAYTEDSEWRNRSQFIRGREQIREFLTEKWAKELDYRLTKSLWSFTENRIAVRFQYEYHNAEGQWFRAYGNELWEFDDEGLMRRREASINDVAIEDEQRRFYWSAPGPQTTLVSPMSPEHLLHLHQEGSGTCVNTRVTSHSHLL